MESLTTLRPSTVNFALWAVDRVLPALATAASYSAVLGKSVGFRVGPGKVSWLRSVLLPEVLVPVMVMSRVA